jgi:hypothetical protein
MGQRSSGIWENLLIEPICTPAAKTSQMARARSVTVGSFRDIVVALSSATGSRSLAWPISPRHGSCVPRVLG